MIDQLKEENIYIDTPVTKGRTHYAKEELFIKRFYTNANGAPVLMIHGSVENGKIFYSSSGKGFAPYLAKKGYDVFVVDLRGRGQSKPLVNKYSGYGLSEILNDDFPLYINKIKELKGNVPQHWIAHSWGGVLILAYLARHIASVKIASMVFFASKRRVNINTMKKFFKVNIQYNLLVPLVIKQKGYFAAKELKVGSDNESKRTYKETAQWVNTKQWKDWNDKFDYAAALKKIKLPPTLYLAAANDPVLGNPKDVYATMKETGDQISEYHILGKANGNMHDYGHINILTHKDCEVDVYPIALEFMKKYS
jgi:predicted alpha/beta hydrolase